MEPLVDTVHDLRQRQLRPPGRERRGRRVLEPELGQLGVVGPGELGQEPEGEVDASGDPTAGDEVAVALHAGLAGDGPERCKEVAKSGHERMDRASGDAERFRAAVRHFLASLPTEPTSAAPPSARRSLE
jgi:hypothetical protein